MKENKEFCEACFHMFVNDFHNGSPSVLSRHTCKKTREDLAAEIVDSRKRACDERLKNWDEWIQPHLGELVIEHGDVSRLIGFSDDSEDYYYVYIEHSKKWHRDKDNLIQLSSCCGGYSPLKGVITDKEYADLEERFKKFDENSGIQSFLDGLRPHKTMFKSKYDKEDYMITTKVFLRREEVVAENDRLINLPIVIK